MKYFIAVYVLIMTACTVSNRQVKCDNYYPAAQAANTSYLINTKEYRGYVFPSTYKPEVLDKGTLTYTLTTEDVALLEKVLNEQYNQAYYAHSPTSNHVPVQNVKKYLKEFDRQYIGFYNQKGEKEAFVYLARINGRTKRHFECFDKVMSIGFGEIYEKNQKFFNVNLETQRLYLK